MNYDWKAKPKKMSKQDQHDEANSESRFEAIEKEADAILALEGTHYVRGVYFVLESDAYMARMVEAERRVAKRDESMDAYIARGPVARAAAVVSGIGRAVVEERPPIVEMGVES